MKLAQRIHLRQIETDAAYAELTAFLDRHRPCFDELTIFDGFCHHGAIPMNELRENAAILKKRIADLHTRGFQSVGINVHCTLGHIDEGYTVYGQPFAPIVGYRGDKSLSCFCPEHEDRKQFLREKYAMYAKTGADFLWVDDDVKFFWNGVKFGCFCTKCMERFNRKMGTDYTRQSLVDAMEQPENIALRAAWVQDVSGRMCDLFSLVEQAVHAVDPKIRLGFMTQHQGWSTYNGMDYSAWFQALHACMGRPGEGYYDDKVPTGVVTKALSCARQASEYPACITDVQYELEDFPNYSPLQKSIRINLDELTLAIAQGMNGLVLNTFSPDEVVNVRELDGMYDAILRQRANWDEMELFARGMHGTGFYPAISAKYDQRRPLHNGQSFFTTYDEAQNHNVMQTYTLSHIGLPLTMDKQNCYGAVFAGDLPDGFTDEELLEFLKKSVLMDADAAMAFTRRGLGRYIGVSVGEEVTDGIEEYFAEHPVNKGIVGHCRDVRPAFYGKGGRLLRALNDAVQPISYLRTLKAEPLGIGASLYENALGGRICVLGYAAFHKIDSYARLRQMRNVAAWMARKQLTVMTATTLAAQFVRTDGVRTMATVLNMSLDVMQPAEYGILGAATAHCLHNGQETILTARVENGMGMFTMPELLPFETVTLLAAP